jgi:CTP synthase
VPLKMQDEGLDRVVLDRLKLKSKQPSDLKKWKEFLKKYKNPKSKLKIGLVGKYVELQDSYKSILEAFIHAGAINEVEVDIITIHSEFISENGNIKELLGLHGILVAPGFGERGIEGKIKAVEFVRKNKIPFFGICLGMQMAIIEYSRNILGLKDANSSEMTDLTNNPVIDLMKDQKNIKNKGGTMRLGSWECSLTEGSLAHRVYGKNLINERHRHRYEFNEKYNRVMFSKNLKASGVNPQTGLVEIIEYNDHPWFVGVQFHPEYKSTVSEPHPLFVSFVEAALKYSKSKI